MSAFRSAREWSNRELRRFSAELGGAVVNVSGAHDDDKQGRRYRDYFPAASSYDITNYKGFRGTTGSHGEIFLDLTDELPPELHRRFDVVVNHTTLEHVYDVHTAFRHLCEMTRDLVVVVVPFVQVTHWSDSFGDFWRFTPMGLRRMYEDNDLTVVHEAAGPRHGEPIYLLFVGSRHPERWTGTRPAERIDTPIGQWIGRHLWADRIVPRLRRALPGRRPHPPARTTAPADL